MVLPAEVGLPGPEILEARILAYQMGPGRAATTTPPAGILSIRTGGLVRLRWGWLPGPVSLYAVQADPERSESSHSREPHHGLLRAGGARLSAVSSQKLLEPWISWLWRMDAEIGNHRQGRAKFLCILDFDIVVNY